MLYLLLVFEIVFYSHYGITDGAYKGVAEWEGQGVVGVGGQYEGGPSLLLGHRQ